MVGSRFFVLDPVFGVEVLLPVFRIVFLKDGGDSNFFFGATFFFFACTHPYGRHTSGSKSNQGIVHRFQWAWVGTFSTLMFTRGQCGERQSRSRTSTLLFFFSFFLNIKNGEFPDHTKTNLDGVTFCIHQCALFHWCKHRMTICTAKVAVAITGTLCSFFGLKVFWGK